MKARSHSVFRTAVLLCICLGLLILDWKSYDTDAQAPCAPRLSGHPKWKAGAVVSIYYRAGDFSTVERQAIERAITNWNNANGLDGNNSGVFIGGPAETTLPFSAFNCLGPGCPSANFPVYYIQKDTIPDAAATTQNFGNMTDGDTHLAYTRISGDVNWLPLSDETGLGLTSLQAHETGHTFKLGDCYPGCDGTSVMGTWGSNRFMGPTPL